MEALDVPRPSLATALDSPEFERMVPSLIKYAKRCLPTPLRTTDHARESLHEAVARCLEGSCPWPEGMDLFTFMQRVINKRAFSAARTAAREWKRTRTVEEVPEVAASEPPGEERIDDLRLLERVRAAAADDETKRYLAIVEAGNVDDQRADYAEAAKWTPEHVSRVHRRLERQLKSAGLLPAKKRRTTTTEELPTDDEAPHP